MQEHIATVFLFYSHIHVWAREERAGSPPSCHRVLAHVDPQIIARGEEGSVRSLNMGLGVWVRRARTRIRVYTCTPMTCIYVYVSMLYNYAKSNLRHFELAHPYAHIRAYNIFAVSRNRYNFSRTYSLGGWGVCTGPPVSTPLAH